MITVENLKKYFPIKGGLFNKNVGNVKAVEDVSFKISEVSNSSHTVQSL